MGWMDTVVSVPAGAWTDDIPDGAASPLILARWRARGRRLTATIRSLVALRFAIGTANPNDAALATVEPWAIPCPWSQWQSYSDPANVAAIDPGLYFVSNQLPSWNAGSGVLADPSPCGLLLRIIPTAANPTVTVTFNTGPSWTPAIPASSGPLVVVYEFLPGQVIGYVSSTGCSIFQNTLYWPLGIVVDPDPAHWLTGYQARPSLQVGAPLSPTARGTYDPANWRAGSYDIAEANRYEASIWEGVQESGRAALPALGYTPLFAGAWMLADWTIPTEAGLVRQDCGVERLATPGGTYGSGARLTGITPWTGAITSAVVMSSPAAIQVRVTASPGVDVTLTVHEAAISDLTASPGTAIDAFIVPAGTPVGTVLVFALSVAAAAHERRRYAVTQTGGGAMTIAMRQSVQHALPFALVASDGHPIPAGEAAALRSAIPAWPTTACALGVATPAAMTQGTYIWAGLAAGLYRLTASYVYCTLTDGRGRIASLRAGSGGYVDMAIPAGGTLTALCHGQAGWAGASSGLLTALAITPQALALGTTAISAFDASARGVVAYSAATSGRYRISLLGDPRYAMLVGLDQAVTAPVSVIRAHPTRGSRSSVTCPPTDTPPTSASYVGLRYYAIGPAPTGAWAGHAGEIAIGILAPGDIAWEFALPPLGMTSGTWRWDGAAWVDHGTTEIGRIDIDLAAGQSLYGRLTYCGTETTSDLPSGELGWVFGGGVPGGMTVTITAL